MSESITVAVGSPDDLRSSIWRLWVQGDEVYFGAQLMLPSLKVSFHKTGRWHIAWQKGLKIKEKTRIICKWRRPDPLNNGLINGIAVLVDPYLPRQPFKNKAIIDPDIKWLPLALYGKFLALKVVIATKKADLDSGRFAPDERILGRLKKANQEQVLLLAHDLPITLELGQRFAKSRSEIKIHFRKENIDRANLLDTTRALSITLPRFPHETPTIYDLSLGWENVSPEPESGTSKVTGTS
jgi:hypothetical protein